MSWYLMLGNSYILQRMWCKFNNNKTLNCVKLAVLLLLLSMSTCDSNNITKYIYFTFITRSTYQIYTDNIFAQIPPRLWEKRGSGECVTGQDDDDVIPQNHNNKHISHHMMSLSNLKLTNMLNIWHHGWGFPINKHDAHNDSSFNQQACFVNGSSKGIKEWAL